jgi:hypothetical protein
MFATVSCVVGRVRAASAVDPRLAIGKKVAVEKSEHDVDVAMADELGRWGRWTLVADDGEAGLLVRLRVSGNAAWGVGHVQAYVLDARTKETLWVSRSQKGLLTIFHGYASPFTRAVSGIVQQMRREISK